MTWASTADVLNVTGTTVTSPQLSAANEVITIYANRTEAASASLASRDLYWLNRAVCWQTVWQMQQPGYDQKSVVASFRQDGLEVNYGGTKDNEAAEWKVSLAPLAARALKNLSWKAGNTLRTPRISTPVGAPLDMLTEGNDPYSKGWE
jgi:hypothetical protein